MSRILHIPKPRGNQPKNPCDTPVAQDYATQDGNRYVCLAGVERQPKSSCPLGAQGKCAWSVNEEIAYYCAWELIRLYQRIPAGAAPAFVIADAIGVSCERIRQIEGQALAKYRKELLRRRIDYGHDNVR